MRKVLALFVITILFISLPACMTTKRGSVVSGAETSIGESAKFTDDEIQAAIDAALVKFKDFIGCTMIRTWYDEERSNDLISQGWLQKQGADDGDIMILFSDFMTSSISANDGFNPNEKYTDWMWIVIRYTDGGEWVVRDWGY